MNGPRLRELIAADLRHYYGHTAMLSHKAATRQSLLRALMDVDFRVVFLWRMSAKLAAVCRPLSTLLYYRIKNRYACDISPSARIAAGLRLMHAFGIVIGPGVQMGRDCVVFGGVVMGNKRPDRVAFEMPTIGDQVILGAGCKILGNVTIPSRILVGANLVVTPRTLEAVAGQMVKLSPP